MKKHIVAWDLGATKCHAGMLEFDDADNNLTCINSTAIFLESTTSLQDLVTQIEQQLNCVFADLDAICIGAAGQYDGKELVLEGVYPYTMNFAEIAEKNQWRAYDVIHDYAPVVCATFTQYMHEQNNVKRLNQSPIHQFGRRVAIGVGTGLGMKDGVLLNNGDFWLGKNEVGHIGITAPPLASHSQIALHAELIKFLNSIKDSPNNPAITFEKILSGMGLVRLYQFFYGDKPDITPEIVSNRMREGKLPELLSAFAWYFGLLIGTVQLTFMPEGGVWITGGVALKNLEVFDHHAFFDGIYASPAYRAQRELFPLGVLANDQHALFGGGYYAVKKLLQIETSFKSLNVVR